MYKKIIFIILIPFISYVIKYIFNSLCSHLLTTVIYGDFMVGIRTLVLASSFILLGTRTASKRYLNKYVQANDITNASHYIRWNLNLIARSGLITTVCLAILLIGMLLLHIFNIQDFRNYHIAYYMLFLGPLAAASALLTTYLQSKDKILLYNLFFQAGDYLIYSILLATLYFFYTPNFNNTWLLGISAIVFIVLLAINVLLTLICLPRELFSSIISFKRKTDLTNSLQDSWLKTSKHFIISENIFVILCAIDLYAVKFFGKDPLNTGQYATTLIIVNVFWLLGNTITAYIEPKLSLYNDQRKYNELKKSITNAMIANFLLSCIALGVILYFGADILRTFGVDYSTHTTQLSLSILAIGSFVGTFSIILASLIGLSGHETWLIYGASLEFVCLLISSIVLTIAYGIIGTAVAASGSIIIKSIFYFFVARYKITVEKPS